jgi:DNA-binding IclR family transcriptional regulator
MSTTLQTADRALRVMQEFRTPAEGLTVTELAARLGLHRSTASRLVSTMEARGFLQRDAAGDRVRLGPEVARLGRLALAGREIVSIAGPVLERLADESGETATLALPAGHEVLTAAQADGKYYLSSGKWVGVRTPLHCAADGKVLLAFGAAEVAAGDLARLTDRTIVARDALARELDAVRRHGFALADGELEQGLLGVAVPVFEDGACIAALCVSGPEYRLGGEVRSRLAPRCLDAAAELERALGAR